MKTYSNPDPRLHVDMLRTQLKINELLFDRAKRENVYSTRNSQKENDLLEEALVLRTIIKKKDDEHKTTNTRQKTSG